MAFKVFMDGQEIRMDFFGVGRAGKSIHDIVNEAFDNLIKSPARAHDGPQLTLKRNYDGSYGPDLVAR